MSESAGLVELDETPEEDSIWKAASRHADGLDLSAVRLPHPEHKVWYCPTVTIWTAHRAEKLFRQYGIDRVYDLGAGDCRFSLWLNERDYDVVAYELNSELVEAVRGRFDLGDMELRERDYHKDYDDMVAPDAAVVAFGGTNELPYTPEEGLGIEGYGEIGISAHYDGELVAGL